MTNCSLGAGLHGCTRRRIFGHWIIRHSFVIRAFDIRALHILFTGCDFEKWPSGPDSRLL